MPPIRRIQHLANYLRTSPQDDPDRVLSSSSETARPYTNLVHFILHPAQTLGEGLIWIRPTPPQAVRAARAARIRTLVVT